MQLGRGDSGGLMPVVVAELGDGPGGYEVRWAGVVLGAATDVVVVVAEGVDERTDAQVAVLAVLGSALVEAVSL